jgi:hypothetical protein
MKTEVKKEFSRKSGQFWLWLGLLLPPAAWAIQLQTVYLTSNYGCHSQDFIPNHVVSVVAILLCLTGGAVSWRNWSKSGGGWKSEEAGETGRSRFMSILGMLVAGLFTLTIFAQWLPTLVGVPCDK